METLEHWVDGAAFKGDSERTGPIYNPAVGSVSREVRYRSTADVATAVASAKAAAPGWADTSSRSASRSCSRSASC